MDADQVVDWARQALTLTLVLGLPVLATALVVGLLVSVLQAVTQVQEQTLSFVPKLLATGVAAILLGPWMIARLLEFGREMFGPLP